MKRHLSKEFRKYLDWFLKGWLDVSRAVDVEIRRDPVDDEPGPGGYRRSKPGPAVTITLDLDVVDMKRKPRKAKRPSSPSRPSRERPAGKRKAKK